MKDATRAAGHLGRRMPSPPLINDVIGAPKFTTEPETADNPYQRIAADLRGAITCGALQPGDQLLTVADLANRYSVVVGTAQRAVAVLRSAGLVTVRRGRRAVVTDPASSREELAEIVNLDVSASSWPTAIHIRSANLGTLTVLVDLRTGQVDTLLGWAHHVWSALALR